MDCRASEKCVVIETDAMVKQNVSRIPLFIKMNLKIIIFM